MKERVTKRGLYNRTTTTPETCNEARQQWKDMASALDTYIENAERYASEVVREAGLAPETLFDVVETENKSRYVRHEKVDCDSLTPVAEKALKVLLRIHYEIRPRLNGARDGVLAGIRLAQEVEHLNTNLAFGKDVESRRTSNQNLETGSALSDDDIRRVVEQYPTRKKQAGRLGLSVRQLQRRLKDIKT